MRFLSTEIAPLTNDFLCTELRLNEFIQSPLGSRPVFHSHPEIEIVFIVEGYGKMVVWNKVENFRPGDIILIGSGVPHIWLNDAAYLGQDAHKDCRVVVTYFNTSKFEKLFDSIQEFSGIRELIAQASGGIRLHGAAKDNIGEKLVSLCSDQGFQKVQGLLQIMHLIATTPDKRFVAERFCPPDDGLYSDRLITVVNYIKENFRQQISLDEIAQVACMSKQYFCRFFRNRTKRTFLQYLYEYRINYACELLIGSNLQIAQISDRCGFKTITWFYKVFKDQMGSSPHQYRKD